MSCWRRTTVLRIPAVCLGFVYWGEWNEFLEKHDEEFCWEPGFFAEALCESYPREEYAPHLPSGSRGCNSGDRLVMGLYPGTVKTVPGPFLDYFLEDILPLPDEENTFHENDFTRPLSRAEKEKYLPLYQELFPAFTPENMKDVRYCRYEWYDGCEASYLY